MPLPTLEDAPLLEVATGLEQLMGDHDLYRQILRRFRQRYQHSAEQARAELLAGDTVSAQRTVHTLKGAAGMIGAQQLYRLSMVLEPLFNGPAAQCIGPLAQLQQALRSLMAAIDTELEGGLAAAVDTGLAVVAAPVAVASTPTAAAVAVAIGSAPTAAAVAVASAPTTAAVAVASAPTTAAVAEASTPMAAAVSVEVEVEVPSGSTPMAASARPTRNMLVQHLARLLEEGDGAAIDVLEHSATVLAAALGAEVFEEVAAAAHQFDFEAALAVLETAQGKLSA